MAIRPRLIAWAEPRHEPIIRSLLADNACELIGVCADNADHAAALARALATEHMTDLRQAVLAPHTEAVWLATPAVLDAALQRAIREHGLLVLSSEPNATLLSAQTGESNEADLVTFVPAFVDGRGFASALDALEQFGVCRALNLVFTSRPEQGSLFARLFDAMLTVTRLLGPAELIEASITSPRSSVPDQLAAMTGTMTLNLRIQHQRTASVLVSNAAPVWLREVTAIGASDDAMRITEEHSHWFGEETDGPGHAAPAEPADPGALIADQLMRLMQFPGESRSHGDGAQLLAMCEAARLSARVGFGEAPGTISRMMGRP